jgi:tetratricopeptide (TPR) repeat protein
MNGPTALAATLALALAMVAPHPSVATGESAPSDSCKIASGGIGSGGNNVTCNFGLSPEQLKQLTEAAVRGATDPLVHQITDVSKTLGVTEDAAKTLLKIVGEDSNIPDDKLATALSKVATDYQRLQQQLAALKPDNPTAKSLVEQAKLEIDSGHFDRAHELLRQATQVQIAAAQQARQLREQAQAAEDAQMLGAARSTAAEGDVAMTERRYEEAARLFDQATDYVPSGHASERGKYLLREGNALYQQGDERGDNVALEGSAAVCKRAMEQYPRANEPLDWAAMQVNLGDALELLGEREAGTGHLDQAVAAYRAALEELTRARVPLAWAVTQMDLGNALEALGEREAGTEHLDQAVTAYRAALEVQARERVPLAWAATQDNLASALEALGEREGGTARLTEAVAAYRAALEERTRERVPLDWAATQDNLGMALEALGERENGTEHLNQAVTAFRAALEERTRERVPLEWGATQDNLASALEALGERENGTEHLNQAVAAYRAALEERTRDRVPLDWAATQDNLGMALEALGERETGTARLVQAVAAYDAALEERTRDRVPLDWATTLGNQGEALMYIADRTHDAAMAERAVGQIKTAYEAERAGGDRVLAADFEERLPEAQAILDRLRGARAAGTSPSSQAHAKQPGAASGKLH